MGEALGGKGTLPLFPTPFPLYRAREKKIKNYKIFSLTAVIRFSRTSVAVSTSSSVIIRGDDLQTMEPDIVCMIKRPSLRHQSLIIAIGRLSTGASESW